MTATEKKARALRAALVIAVSYVGATCLYIAVSGELAARLASDLGELQHFELIKGFVSVGITGCLLFGLAYTLFLRQLLAAADATEAREALLRADRQAVPGLLAASIAHDFRNALAVARASAELLEEDLEREERIAVAEDLRSAVDHAGELAKHLSTAGRSSASGSSGVVDVSEVVAAAVELVRHHPLARGRSLVCEAQALTPICVYPTLVQQIVTNLVLNGLDVGTKVIVCTALEGDSVVIEVHDDGPGVSAEHATRIFEPFYTTRPGGTGLGLVSVRACAHLHAGSVVVGRSTRLGGASFRVTLRGAPLERGTAQGAPRVAAPPSTPDVLA